VITQLLALPDCGLHVFVAAHSPLINTAVRHPPPPSLSLSR
jgi:hypothetical protein